MRLRYVDPNGPGIVRRRQGKGFVYFGPDGRRLIDAAELARIKALVIPPAWAKVWISPAAHGHIQAVGRDARGRRQYIYHPRFRAERDAAKYERLIGFARRLPALRQRIAEDMALAGLPRRKVVATVVHLLDKTLIRIGNKAYAEQNRSFGLSTLRSRHVAVAGTTVRFAFKGKSGKEWSLAISDRRVAKVIRACQDLPGQHLFQYVDTEGGRGLVSSEDVNTYLREAAGSAVSAKDFRTWAGTVLCAVTLAQFPGEASEAARKRHVAQAIRFVAQRLGNTPAICRACYVHPAILDAFAEGSLRRRRNALLQEDDATDDLAPAEATVLRVLLDRRAERPRRQPRSVGAEVSADTQDRPADQRASLRLRARGPATASSRTRARSATKAW